MFLLQVSIPEKEDESSVFIRLFVPQDSWFPISEHRLWGGFCYISTDTKWAATNGLACVKTWLEQFKHDKIIEFFIYW